MEQKQDSTGTQKMAVSMQAPVCLVDNGPDGCMRVQQEALQVLEQIQQPVVVVAVVGLYRTGKSYLMNRLAGKHTGFALGSTIESQTKGIWMWCVPHPSKPGHTLALLDTEGLGDVDKGDAKHDTQIFSLAILLSSTLVYNSRGTIDNKTVEELQYVTELAEYIKVKSSDEDGDDTEFVKFFPSFIWAVRDFSLERKIDGKDATEDEYLEFALKLKSGASKKIMEYNLARECIRKYFPSRKCFTFPLPCGSEDMTCLGSLPESKMAPAFLEVTERFCTFVFDQSPVKQLKDGHTVDGRILGHLVKMYVESISSGVVPCLENSVVAMAQIENEAAVKEGLEVYESDMAQLRAKFPVDLCDITAEHQRLSTLATEVFMKRSFKDDEGKHIKSLEEAVNKLFSGFLHQNEETSVLKCQEVLTGLSAPLREKCKEGFYMKPGGYQFYCKDMEDIEKKYTNQTHLGVKAEVVLEEFLKQRKEESSAILHADQSLSDRDRQICEERERAVMLEQEVKANEERQRQLEERMVAEQRSNEERMRQVKEKMEQEMRQQQEEAQRATASQLREQSLLLEKGFQEKANRLGQEIRETQRRAEEAQEARSQEMTRLLEQQDRRHNDTMTMFKEQNKVLKQQQKEAQRKEEEQKRHYDKMMKEQQQGLQQQQKEAQRREEAQNSRFNEVLQQQQKEAQRREEAQNSRFNEVLHQQQEEAQRREEERRHNEAMQQQKEAQRREEEQKRHYDEMMKEQQQALQQQQMEAERREEAQEARRRVEELKRQMEAERRVEKQERRQMKAEHKAEVQEAQRRVEELLKQEAQDKEEALERRHQEQMEEMKKQNRGFWAKLLD